MKWRFETVLKVCFLQSFLYTFELYLFIDLRFARYRSFRLGSERDAFRLYHQNLYYGNAGDSLYSHNGMPFSTFDVDNDNRDGTGGNFDETSCARLYKVWLQFTLLLGKYIFKYFLIISTNLLTYWLAWPVKLSIFLSRVDGGMVTAMILIWTVGILVAFIEVSQMESIGTHGQDTITRFEKLSWRCDLKLMDL